jgi:hypothetical protein
MISFRFGCTAAIVRIVRFVWDSTATRLSWRNRGIERTDWAAGGLGKTAEELVRISWPGIDPSWTDGELISGLEAWQPRIAQAKKFVDAEAHRFRPFVIGVFSNFGTNPD